MTETARYVIRNYRPSDFDNYAALCREAAKMEPGGRHVSPPAVARRLAHPRSSPEQDIFICEIPDGIVGYIDIVPELGIGRVILSCWLHPGHRKKGLAAKLIDRALHRASELGARAAHVNISEDNATAKTVLSRLGFRYVRRFLEFEMDVTGFHYRKTEREVRECRPLRRGEEDILTQVQNISFAGQWGYNPNTLETTTYQLSLYERSPEDVFLAYEGDEATGFCWTETISQREGRIFMLGVVPDCRRRGTGRRLLLTGLAHLKSKGTQVVVLTVDGENKKACALYRSTGFRLRTSSLWFEKSVP